MANAVGISEASNRVSGGTSWCREIRRRLCRSRHLLLHPFASLDFRVARLLERERASADRPLGPVTNDDHPGGRGLAVDQFPFARFGVRADQLLPRREWPGRSTGTFHRPARRRAATDEDRAARVRRSGPSPLRERATAAGTSPSSLTLFAGERRVRRSRDIFTYAVEQRRRPYRYRTRWAAKIS